MKYRSDFVTNSSSSSFIIVSVDSPTIHSLIDDDDWDMVMETLDDESSDFYVSHITTSTAESLLFILFNLLGGFEDEDLNNEFWAEHNEIEGKENLNNISSFVDKWFPEAENNDGDIATFKIMKVLIEHQKEIDSDATATIECVDVYTEGELSLSYEKLVVADGDGTFQSYYVLEPHRVDNTNPSPFYLWALNHGYYDDGYSDDLYFARGDERVYDEIADSYQGVYKVHVKNGKAFDNNRKEVQFDDK